MKLLTFMWSVTIQAPDTFDSSNLKECDAALKEAWSNISARDGELTDEQNEPPDGSFAGGFSYKS